MPIFNTGFMAGDAFGVRDGSGRLILDDDAADDLNGMLAELRRVGKVDVASPLEYASEASGRRWGLGQVESIYVKISGATNPYNWAEAYRTPGGVSATVAGGRTGQAYEANSTSSAGLNNQYTTIHWSTAGDWRFQISRGTQSAPPPAGGLGDCGLCGAVSHCMLLTILVTESGQPATYKLTYYNEPDPFHAGQRNIGWAGDNNGIFVPCQLVLLGYYPADIEPPFYLVAFGSPDCSDPTTASVKFYISFLGVSPPTQFVGFYPGQLYATMTSVGCGSSGGTGTIVGTSSALFSGGSSYSPGGGSAAIAGSASVAFGGGSTRSPGYSTLHTAGSSSAAFGGGSMAPMTLAASGTSSVAFGGGSTIRSGGTITAAAGSSTVAWGSGVRVATALAATGSSPVAWGGGSHAGGGIVHIQGSAATALAGGSTARAKLVATGSSAVGWSGGESAHPRLSGSGSSSVHWAGGSHNQAPPGGGGAGGS